MAQLVKVPTGSLRTWVSLPGSTQQKERTDWPLRVCGVTHLLMKYINVIKLLEKQPVWFWHGWCSSRLPGKCPNFSGFFCYRIVFLRQQVCHCHQGDGTDTVGCFRFGEIMKLMFNRDGRPSPVLFNILHEALPPTPSTNGEDVIPRAFCVCASRMINNWK